MYRNYNSGSYRALIYRLTILALCFFVALLVAGGCALWVSQWFTPLSRDYYLAQSAVQNGLGFIGAALAAAWIISCKPAGFLGLTQSVGWRPFVGVLIVYLIGIPFMNQLIYYNEQLHLPTSMKAIEDSMRAMEEQAAIITRSVLSTSSIGGLISGILIIGVFTGLAEELFFRGALQRSLTAYSPMRWWSVWIAAAIFSAVHLQFFGFFPRLLLGAFFGYLLYTTGSIWPGIFAHALNNSIVVVTEWCRLKSGSEYLPIDRLTAVGEGFPGTALTSLGLLILFFYFYYPFFFRANSRPGVKS